MRVHFVGIGGAALSALAHIHLERGDEVSGSDQSASEVTDALAAAGAIVNIGHRAENVAGADLVVTTTALDAGNPEVAEARRAGIRVVHRSIAVAELVRGHRQVAVAGTHGKTTTTTMVASVLEPLDPLVLSGGRLPGTLYNSRFGQGDVAVVEADESDRSFLELTPHIGVVTNVEFDHPDHYRDLDEVARTFDLFASRVSSTVVGCVDDPGARALLAAAPGEVLGYGFHPADIQGSSYRAAEGGSTFHLSTPWGEGRAQLEVPGRHNARNAMAAAACGLLLGLDVGTVLEALGRVRLPGRRMELVAEVNGARVYDDYAHHPTKVATTLHAARELTAGRLICVFQPHRFTRLHALMEEFAGCFPQADEVILLPLYSAGEDPIEGVDSAALMAAVRRVDPARAISLLASLDDLPDALRALLKPGDVAVCMGAGDVYKATRRLAAVPAAGAGAS